MTSGEEVLRYLALASRGLLTLADPLQSSDDPSLQDQENWNHAVPLDWQLQLRFLWVSAADAFDLVANTLPVRVSASLLAQIRLLLEHYCIVRWLTDPKQDHQRRAIGFAASEVKDVMNVLLKWTGYEADRQPTLDDLQQADIELQAMAGAEGLEKVPSMPDMVNAYYKKVAWAFLSDVGSHAGLAPVLVYFLRLDEHKIDLNMHEAFNARTYFLGMAFELYALISINICVARGWAEHAAKIQAHLDATGDLLKRATQLLQSIEA